MDITSAEEMDSSCVVNLNYDTVSSLLGRVKIQENPYHQDSPYGNASNHSHKPRLANIHHTLATLGALTLLTLYIYDSWTF